MREDGRMLQFPDVLRTWRKARRFSQLDLAMEAGVSPKHLSFLETGRARPSPEMIERLGDALCVPLTARNQMLTLAGFATRYAARSWDAEEMLPFRAAVEYTLERHAPYPGFAVDRLWMVTTMNAPARHLFGALGVRVGGSLLDLLASGELEAHVENWVDVAHHAALRLRTESAAQGGVPRLDEVAEALSRARGRLARPTAAVLPTILRVGAARLSLFATLSQFGTPEDLTLDELKLELYFPSDRASDSLLRAMSAATSLPPSPSP